MSRTFRKPRFKDPILRKGGVHRKSKKAQRADAKKVVQSETTEALPSNDLTED